MTLGEKFAEFFGKGEGPRILDDIDKQLILSLDRSTFMAHDAYNNIKGLTTRLIEEGDAFKIEIAKNRNYIKKLTADIETLKNSRMPRVKARREDNL